MDRLIEFVIDQWMLFAIAAAIIAMFVHNLLSAKLSGIANVGVNEAVRLMNKEDAFVLDVRLENEFKQGHIENATHIPVGALEARLREIEKHKARPIVVNCQSGNRSFRAAQILRKNGFEKVYNLSGGISAWINANMPVTTGGKRK